MRIIDANRLKISFEANTPLAFQDCVPGIHAIIDLEPTVDAAPIVRCKDCINRYSTCPMIMFYQSGAHGSITYRAQDDWWCCFGKKNENE